ncbi:MAG: metal ABC transporter ATP-binding protein [bacterium]|nr:metal ABC transporter ATP-binding protein [bacterium]
MSAAPAISVRDLDFAYGRQPVLQGVHFDVNVLDFVSVIGPNGGGKSTLLKLLLGLLSPRRGTIEVFGSPPSKARLKLGYMPQRVELDPRFPVTVMDVTIMGRLGLRPTLGPYRRRDREAALAALEATDAADLRDRPFSELSGGQRQKVLIARALCGEPEILLLDEPTASLDPAVQDDLYALLNRLNDTRTILMVSHDVSMVSRFVNRVLCVNRTCVEHCVTEIPQELSLLFDAREDLRLVRHDHDHTDHPPGSGACHD